MAPQTITDCGNFTLDLKQCGFCASPLSLLQTSGDPDFQRNAKLLSSENITLDHSAAVQSFFVFSPGENASDAVCCSRVALTQEWRQLKPMSCIRLCVSGSWSTDSSCSPLFVNLPHIFEWVFVSQSSPGVRLSLLLVHFFSTTIFSFPSPLY